MEESRLIDEWAKRNEERALASRDLQRIVTKFPELLEDLLRFMAHASPNGSPATHPPRIVRRKPRAAKGTAFERIARLFLKNNNQWLDTSELVKQSGVQRNVAATVMWSVHRSDFEQRPHDTHKKMKIWRLTPQAFDRLKDQRRLFADQSAEGGG